MPTAQQDADSARTAGVAKQWRLFNRHLQRWLEKKKADPSMANYTGGDVIADPKDIPPEYGALCKKATKMNKSSSP